MGFGEPLPREIQALCTVRVGPRLCRGDPRPHIAAPSRKLGAALCRRLRGWYHAVAGTYTRAARAAKSRGDPATRPLALSVRPAA
jgi:hypothetical protein